MIQAQWDAVVIGAGPAGLNAACGMAEFGLRVALVDEQPAPGGQIYRGVTHPEAERRFREHDEYRRGLDLVRRFLRSTVEYMPGTLVWMLEPNRVFCLRDGRPFELKTRLTVVAVGAMERPAPFPGWTLPGVMTAGSADILRKGAGTAPQGPVILAGSGPLLPLAGSHLARDGALACVLDSTPPGNLLRAAPWAPLAAAGAGLLLRGARMLRTVKKSGAPLFGAVRDIAAHGSRAVEEVSFSAGGKTLRVPAKTLLYHAGVIPRTQISRALRLAHVWNARQQCWQAATDIFGESSRQGIYLIGDCAQVRGADAAALKGKICAAAVAKKDRLIPPREAFRLLAPLFAALARVLAPRPFVDALFTPRGDIYQLADDVVVCRCENITAGEIRAAVADGLHEVNEIKLFTRAGMGNCQGRTCGPAVAGVAARALGVNAAKTGYLSCRQPVRPVPLGVFSRLFPE